MALPSIRECEERLTALAQAPATDDNLARAVTLGRTLLHYVRNTGTPPERPASAKLQAQSLPLRTVSRPAHLLRPMEKAETLPKVVNPSTPWRKPGHAAPIKTRQLVERKARAPFEVPAGMCTLKQFAERAGRSESWVNLLMRQGQVPRPHEQGNNTRPSLWTEEQVATSLARIAAGAAPRVVVPATPAAAPPDWVSTAQLAERIGAKDVNRVHYLVHMDRIPKAKHRQGHLVYWLEAEAAAIVEEISRPAAKKAAPTTTKGKP